MSSAARVVGKRDFLGGLFLELLDAPFLLIEDSLAVPAAPILSSLLNVILSQR